MFWLHFITNHSNILNPIRRHKKLHLTHCDEWKNVEISNNNLLHLPEPSSERQYDKISKSDSSKLEEPNLDNFDRSIKDMGWPMFLKQLICKTNKTLHNIINKSFIKILSILFRLPINNKSEIIFWSLF
jgi:hypothetical protein